MADEITETPVENTEVVEETPAAGGEAAPEGEGTAATETPSEDGEGEPPAEGEAAPEGEGAGEGGEGEGGEGAAFKPNTVFKAGVYNKDTKQLEQKEFTIDDKFKSLMTDPESEKLVRELHEKAYGLDSVKERFNETRNFAQQVVSENSEIKASINKVKSVYNNAVKTGNWHKLDDFFALLDIPQENVLQYALAKVKLAEMAPEQRQAFESNMASERRAEQLQQERDNTTQQNATLAQQNKAMQVDFVLAKPEVASLATEFDKRAGKPGAFKEAVAREGSMAWTLDKTDLPAGEAVERVIKNYGLSGIAGAAPQTQGAASPGNGAAAPKVVKRTTQTIPNVQSRSASPLPSKPKTMEELLKYRKETHGF